MNNSGHCPPSVNVGCSGQRGTQLSDKPSVTKRTRSPLQLPHTQRFIITTLRRRHRTKIHHVPSSASLPSASLPSASLPNDAQMSNGKSPKQEIVPTGMSSIQENQI
ncbi:hypothetical protein BaRGS_00032033 [Batillaria attramentaria]|uniref:Uncharacterized protein n=1 Tax=Batillaria attramentaria TaxID=370345 RepID=A0ABD0JPT7_9CAEN